MERAKQVFQKVLKENIVMQTVRQIKTNNQKSDSFVVEMQGVGVVSKVLDVAANFKAEGLSVHKDYPVSARRRRKRMMDIKNQVLSECSKLNVKVKGERLIVEGKEFFLHDDVLMYGDETGYHILRQIIDGAKATASSISTETQSAQASSSNNSQNNGNFLV